GSVGAYGFAMASNYASSMRPAQVVVDGETVTLGSRREEPADLWRLEDPGTTPEATLRAALSELARGPSGIPVLYTLFADSLKAKIGDLDAVTRTFGNELYGPLVGTGAPTVRTIEVRGSVARAEIVASGGAAYVVSLARRDHGEQSGTWTITALARDLPGAG